MNTKCRLHVNVVRSSKARAKTRPYLMFLAFHSLLSSASSIMRTPTLSPTCVRTVQHVITAIAYTRKEAHQKMFSRAPSTGLQVQHALFRNVRQQHVTLAARDLWCIDATMRMPCRCGILFWPPCQIDRAGGPSDTASMWPRLYHFDVDT